jgi:hypothetical protein
MNFSCILLLAFVQPQCCWCTVYTAGWAFMMWLPTVQFVKTFKSFFKEKVLADICFLLPTLYFTILLDMLLKLLPCKYFLLFFEVPIMYANAAQKLTNKYQ